MIRTPLGQWISENDILHISISDSLYFWSGEQCFTGFTLKVTFKLNQELIISNTYKSRKKAQSELDKMFSAPGDNKLTVND